MFVAACVGAVIVAAVHDIARTPGLQNFAESLAVETAWKAGATLLGFAALLMIGLDVRASQMNWNFVFGLWAVLVLIAWIYARVTEAQTDRVER